MPPDNWIHGSPIQRNDDGSTSLRYLSPSAITLFDPQSEGCPRKWWHQYIDKKKQPESASQKLGTALHADIERYLKTGQRDLSALALAGLHMVPAPGPDLGVELEMSSEFSDPDHKFVVDEAWALREAGDFDGARRMLEPLGMLTAGGVPIIGRIDLVHERCTNQGTENPDEAIDPPGTVEVYDWKTSKNVGKYAKTAAQLAHNIQMLAYANWVLIKSPEVQRVRISHGYFQTEGARKTRKVTTVLERDVAARRWEYADNLVRRIVHAARARDHQEVEANTSACESFGGCPHRDYCKVKRGSGIAGFFRKKSDGPELVQIKRKDTKKMGFLDKLRKTDAARKGEDTAKVDPRFADAWKTITSLGYGEPATGGEVAAQLAIVKGVKDYSSGFGGSGEMGKTTIITMDDLLAIAAECAEDIAASEDAANAEATGQKAEDKTAPATPAKPPIGLAPDAPASDPAMASAGAEGKDPLKPDKKPGKKSTKTDPPAAKTETKAEPTAKSDTATPAPDAGPGIMLFVSAYPKIGRGTAPNHQDLGPWVANIWGQLCEAAGGDPRLSNEKPFSFGGWRGMIANMVADPEETPLAPGMWVLDARGSEVNAEFVTALDLSGRLSMIVRGL